MPRTIRTGKTSSCRTAPARNRAACPTTPTRRGSPRTRAADLALRADAVRHVRALAGALAELREGAELLTTCLYFGLVHEGLADLGEWLSDAIRELRATPTPAEEAAFRAEQAELHERLWCAADRP